MNTQEKVPCNLEKLTRQHKILKRKREKRYLHIEYSCPQHNTFFMKSYILHHFTQSGPYVNERKT